MIIEPDCGRARSRKFA